MTYRVLIVDDSKLARMAVARSLKSLRPEWCIVEAADAAAATTLAQAEKIDLVLLDVNMPGQDGLSLAPALQTLCPGAKVAIVSANHQKEIVAQATAIGAAFLPKPLTAEALAGFLGEMAQDTKP